MYTGGQLFVYCLLAFAAGTICIRLIDAWIHTRGWDMQQDARAFVTTRIIHELGLALDILQKEYPEKPHSIDDAIGYLVSCKAKLERLIEPIENESHPG